MIKAKEPRTEPWDPLAMSRDMASLTEEIAELREQHENLVGAHGSGHMAGDLARMRKAISDREQRQSSLATVWDDMWRKRKVGPPPFYAELTMPRDPWRELLEAAQAGKAPKVLLSPGQRIMRHRRPGRPRVFGWNHYAGFIASKGGRPRCAVYRCKKYLTISQPLGCCPDHEKQAVKEAKAMLERAQELLAKVGL